MVKFNGVDWNILLVSPNHPALKRMDGTWTLGACADSNKTIYISNILPINKLKKVLCHELTHAAMFSYDVKLSLPEEELLADLIATYGQEIIEATNKFFLKIKKRRI